MQRAVELAAERLGLTGANPTVGCVVLDERLRVVGEGSHRHDGEPHAEVVALAAAGTRARGGTAVVTLEPCAHTGRTGPCTEALRAAGVARVVYAVADPTPRAGGGAAVLAAAGIATEGGLLAAEATRANRYWLTNATRLRPWVTWKFGATLDGRIAAADGSSRWITSAAARADAHLLRARHGAVLVGAGTVRTDDPHLGVRHGVAGPAPVRVVVAADPSRLPATARVFDGSARTLLAVPERFARAAAPPGAELLPIGPPDDPSAGPADGPDDGQVDPRALLSALLGLGIRSVLVEGGPRTAARLLAADCVDEAVGHLAPALLGAGPALLGDLGICTIGGALRWEFRAAEPVGPDLRVSVVPVPDLRVPDLPVPDLPVPDLPGEGVPGEGVPGERVPVGAGGWTA
ncbi:bifunctional diaminohydroxyphosphoribosylaminopyrimidine deaminase/5-amino-6-(5-phosphoribosylamino)uracil reductase RibD [Kitasatospora sp. YST-16]|uniref:bifunctional diaminohydroxyphosphoribosylaminopyrimidine deaminase/5-amino-6-(5-phosphoribosylamino)uracil reductase RibD n=1 Tax=unclassified Kitasatospora TaxID=2633591 RepID=UPI0009DD5C87|nr:MULTISPECIES: bifunctional diaminohydroxyphosphoribosylaminopyrimidine deaminase/5-amino-6-(5-phosphoribosylamino)uracil reductase RibD [unclassified Kitasatospora]WAL76395.1 bifunctional diaminohydroxyphosphoribosylaminopyrimidine deaminase/5-amino-6-(5-phosphoribosylamino)uracil reductase RibD [Kitasatospora sp. YST-16]